MALIDIDRHILSEIVDNNRYILLKLNEADESMKNARDAYQRNAALILHLVGEIKEVDTGKGREGKKETKKKED